MQKYNKQDANEIENKCCGTCKWHYHESIDGGRMCVNGDSDFRFDRTDYEFCCGGWEARNLTNTEKALKHYKAIQRALEECQADNDVVMFTREAVVALEKQIASEKSFSEAKKNGIGR